MTASLVPRAIALLLLAAATGVPPVAALEPAPAEPPLRIVPAVRYDRVPADGNGSRGAPLVRPQLAWYQDTAPPGGLAVVYTPEGRESFETVLLDSQGRIVARGTSFRWGAGWLSLVGVPSTVRLGRHELWLPGIRLPFFVTARTFASETIPLTSTLSALRSQPDQRKTDEARELAQLLAASDPEAMYETEAFALPLTGFRRTAGYGDRRVYRYDNGSTATSVHTGVDLALPEGTPVASCGAGRVAMAKERVITGGTVIVEHLPGLYSLYAHLSAISVLPGELVEKGQLLGLVGKTGLATGAHLHWEVVAGGVAVDPDFLTAGLPFVPGTWPIPAVSSGAAEPAPADD